MARTLLIVDDLAANRWILSGMLNKEYTVWEASGGQEALELLSREHAAVSAVLLDIGMPGMDGYEVLRRIRSDAALSQMPVIMITGSEDEQTRVKSLSLGANDFVMKPYSSEIIKHCLKNNIALREAAETVSALQRDKLTGLYNREAFFERVERMVAAHAPGYYIMGCFDIDKFKVVNDQYGTRKGDEVLVHTATVFRDGFAPWGGVCCRIFADNFAAIYPASFRDTPEIKAIHARASHVEGLVLPITFSVGRYIIDDLTLSPSAMYDRAVLAANSVKGRYDVHIAVYDESMREQLIREQELVLEMEDALSAGQFEVWYQPQYNHSTEAMIGAEALVRWRHPRKGLIPPDRFIPVFEQNGFVYALDKFVWEEVCRSLRKWLDEGRSPLPVSVNISRYDMFRPDLIEVLTGLVRRYDLPIALLRLEITESAFAESAAHIVEIVRSLIGLGFTVEIDDFGSGYSSLNTLKDVPAQIIKLDMKFLEGTDDTQRGGNIVESIVRMAKWLGMSIIAEGVETLEQADYLRSVGCSYVQGYLYARPMELAAYEAHCREAGKEERLLALETVENLDNNAFWDPESMDTLIFNSYVGGACIYEYYRGNIELLRATEKYAQVIGSAGMTVEDALKLNWTEHLGEGDRGRLIADLNESIETRSEVTGEYVFLDLPGCPHETYLRSTLRVIASAGERYLVYCTNENITAQRAAERTERRLSGQMQAIMDNVDLGIIAAIVEGDTARYVFANDRYYQMLGYSKERFEAEVHSPYQTVAPEDCRRVMEETARINRADGKTVLVYDAVKADGGRRTFRAAISVAHISGIELPVQLTILRDITEEIETQRRERSAIEQIETMMNDMPGGFVRLRVEPDGRVSPVYINEGFLALVGRPYDEVAAQYGDDTFAGVHPDDVGAAMNMSKRMLEHGEASGARYRVLSGTRGYVWLSVFGRVTHDAGGTAYLNLYYTDATGQVQEEETQRALLDNLPGGAGLYVFADGALSIVYLNASYWALVGREPRGYTGLLPLGAVHPDDLPVVTRELLSAIEQKRDMVCDMRLRHETDGYCSVHLVGRIVPARGGEYRIYATFVPIETDQMSYQQMLPLLLSAMMESTTDLSFTKDTEFRYLTASRAFANLVGQADVNDVIGKTDFDLFEPAMAEKFRRDDEALLAGGQSIIDMVEPIPSEDGAPHYSSTSKYVLRDGSGEIIGLYGVGRDVTKAVVQDSQLRLVNDSIPGGLATYLCINGAFSPDSVRLTYFNDGFCNLFGFTREEYESRAAENPMGLVFEEDLPILAKQWRALMNENAPIDCLYRARVNGGGYKWINHRAVATDRRNDRVVVNAILQDVTDSRELIEQLRISEEESNLAVRLGGNIISRYLVAEKTLTISTDTASAYSLPEEIGNVPEEPIRLGMISPESADAYRGFFDAIQRGSKAVTAIFQQRYFNEWRWMEAKGTTVFSDDGKPVKAVISFYDITDRLERETIYKKWQQSLLERRAESYTLFRCNLNNDRARALAEGTLMTFDFDHAGANFNERARAYVKQCVWPDDRDRYIAFANSDTMLLGYYRGKRSDMIEYRERTADDAFRWLRLSVDLVEYPSSTEVEAYLMYEDIDEAKRAELATKALSEKDPLTGLLNRTTFIERVGRILHNSRPGTRHALLMLDIDGFKLVNDVFGHATGDRTLGELAELLRTMVRKDDLVARIGGDEFMVFLNDVLDDAAVEAKARQICAASRKSFSMEVAISASVGIALSPHDGIEFDTLYQKADAALYHVKGSGKDGCAFYDEDMADEHLKPEADVVTVAGAVRPEKKRRMLIVDDNRIDYALLQNLFREEFIIEKAKDGNTALIRLRHYGGAISVVLLDLMMPGMDGFAVLERMQESPELRAIPVIIVSGDESREACLSAIRQGATDYITKPVDSELLRIRVHSAVSKAENERLRAKNYLLEAKNEERTRFETALESTGMTFIEYDWLTGGFTYHPSITRYLLGTFDGRGLWKILLSDMVADTKTVQTIQHLVHRIAEDREQTVGSVLAALKTPQGRMHRFRVVVRKRTDAYQLTSKLMIAFNDLDYEIE